ncbi:MAG TPA: metallophosphoesterase [Thermoanaerobaculia bacterium]|nr:metallophosphoesterase [Thermoanaerobaculia bacterium]
MRIAALADLHYTRTSRGQFDELFRHASGEADVLLLCGDLTDYGLTEEAELLAEDLQRTVDVPVVAVLGNHDYESGHPEEVKHLLTECGLLLLDGDACELDGVGFAGAKGFAGGFGRGALSPWGEPAIKQFVQAAVDEALKLETALSRLKTRYRVVVLHYSPIEGTVIGEPREIFPYLGCSRLEEPLKRYPVDVVFHGHAHRGAPEGVTEAGVPVYNVSVATLKAAYPDRLPIRFLEIGKGSQGRTAPAPSASAPGR